MFLVKFEHKRGEKAGHQSVPRQRYVLLLQVWSLARILQVCSFDPRILATLLFYHLNIYSHSYVLYINYCTKRSILFVTARLSDLRSK